MTEPIPSTAQAKLIASIWSDYVGRGTLMETPINAPCIKRRWLIHKSAPRGYADYYIVSDDGLKALERYLQKLRAKVNKKSPLQP